MRYRDRRTDIGDIGLNNASVLGLKQRLIAEQQNAAQIRNNIGLTQAQITAQRNASIAAQRSLQLQIAQKQQAFVDVVVDVAHPQKWTRHPKN